MKRRDLMQKKIRLQERRKRRSGFMEGRVRSFIRRMRLRIVYLEFSA